MPRSMKYLMAKYNFRPFEVTPGAGTKRIRHIRLTFDMMDSKAWRELSASQITLYLGMKKKYNGGNEKDISFTYAEGNKLMAKKTFTKAMDELIRIGFVDLVVQGWMVRQPNIYAFSDRWQKYGQSDFVKKERRKRGQEQRT